MHAIEVTRATRLPELVAELLAFAVQLRRAQEPDAATLRAEVRKLMSELDAAAQTAGKDPTTVQSVRYALCAFLDEIVLSSNWSIRQDWAGMPLQMEYFNDFTAGEEFYRKLEALRGSSDAVRREALEVYGLCLGLGFRGKHAGMSGMEEIKQLRARIQAELAGGNLGPQPLSVHWQVDTHLPQLVQRIPAWVIATVCGGALLVVLVVLRLWLNHTESSFLGGG